MPSALTLFAVNIHINYYIKCNMLYYFIAWYFSIHVACSNRTELQAINTLHCNMLIACRSVLYVTTYHGASHWARLHSWTAHRQTCRQQRTLTCPKTNHVHCNTVMQHYLCYESCHEQLSKSVY